VSQPSLPLADATPAPMPGFGLFLSQANKSQALGFTDFSTTMPSAADQPVLRRVAEEIIPELRAAQA
jgi:hypothetical protein